jgi:transposase
VKATVVVLSADERQELERRLRAPKTAQGDVIRAQIILAAAEGQQTGQIAQRLGIRPASVSLWRKRFARERLAGLVVRPRSGRPRVYRSDTEKRVLGVLDQQPPDGYAQWNGVLLAQALGDVSKDQVWRVLRKHGICLQRRRSWCVSTDAEFGPKSAAIVGLYLDPPENALVLCVDEKPHIQALERAQGWLKLPNGKSLTGFNHGYRRHGTTTLFAALDVATGLVTTGHYNRRRRIEFLDFMNGVMADVPEEQEVHVILDNLNTHKPKNDQWLLRHPNVHFHYTPTHASWLNQIECWFSILTRSALKGASFTSPAQLREAIDRFVATHNAKAAPFHWTKTQVHSVGLSRSYADLCK